MSALGRFEHWMESLVEGSARRLFRSRITAAEITRRLERAMESQQTITVDRIIVPSFYSALLHPEDFAAFEAIQQDLEQEMGIYLLELAQERGFTLLQHPVVDVTPDPSVARHTIRVVADMVPPGQAAPPNRSNGGGAYVGTQIMGAQGSVPPAPPQARVRTELVLRLPDGEYRYPLMNGSTIGRGLDNDVVLDDARVSRRHAQVWNNAGRFSISDQGSTNGTFVNNRPVNGAQPLQPGDVVSLGGLELRFDQY